VIDDLNVSVVVLDPHATALDVVSGTQFRFPFLRRELPISSARPSRRR
jgi:hypothetical protein